MVDDDGSAFSSQLIDAFLSQLIDSLIQNDVSSLTIDRPTNFTHSVTAYNDSQNNTREGIIPPDISVPAVMPANIANIATSNDSHNQQYAASAPNNSEDPKWLCLDPR